MYSFFYVTFVRKCLPRTKMECELSVCDSFLFWAVKNESSSLDLSKCFRARYAPHWKKYKHNNHFSFSTKPSSLTKSMVQNDLCINKHHLRTHDMWMCFCGIKAKIWHHIFLTSYLQCVRIIRRFSYSFMLLTQPCFLSFYRSSEFLETWAKLV